MLSWIFPRPFLALAYAFLAFIIYSLVKPYILRFRLPPGPIPLPLIGNLLLFKGSKQTIFQDIIKIGKQYGDPLTIWFGSKPIIFVNTFENVRKIFADNPQDFANRPNNIFVQMKLPSNDAEGIVWGKFGPVWQLHKKFGIRVIKRVIDSKRLEENVIMASDQIIQEFTILPKDDPVDFSKYASNLVYNILAALCFGIRYSMNDPQFVRFIKIRTERADLPGWFFLFMLIPGMDKHPELLKKLPLAKKLTEENSGKLNDIKAYLDKHKQNFDSRRGTPDEVRDIVDAMLEEREEMMKSRDPNVGSLTDTALLLMIFDIFVAGTETTIATLKWFILEMVVNPELQEKCSALVRSVVGQGVPSLEDRPNLQLVEAAIFETLRLHPVAPIAVPHAASTEGALMCNKYGIPKDMNVMYNIYAVQRSPELFEQPDLFKPERFLDSPNSPKLPGWIPFGVGRRVCMGEAVARNDLFLICCSLLQRIKFKPIPEKEYPTDPGNTSGGFGNEVKDKIEYLVEIRDKE